ncbi:Hypothetical protein CINCED_3A014993 [Cinara cedri]|uniref:CCDC66 domain-containing protein n=1 Tax=Cinara cedri TaxID=506608 RepID=A0A5E4MZ88_9HEMI|nr:Hypothetical protein CINCED_3A014993 [Cinara cedri]
MVFYNYNNVLINTENRENLVSPDIKVRRNVRFGEYSPLNPANQVNSQPYLGIGEYENKRKKILELQRKEYIEHLSKSKQKNNVSNLPKLPAFSCNEAFKSAMENNSNSKQIKLGDNIDLHQEDTIQIVPPFVDGVESCAFNEEQIKDANKLKQELYRFELSKQIEEKKKYELERKHKEQMEDDKIERAARDQENKIKRAYEKEAEKRIMAQIQKQLQQEKLNHEIMQKQKDLEKKSWSMPSVTVPRQENINDKTMQKQNDLGTKLWNMPLETLPQQVTKHVQSRGDLFENCDTEEFHCPQSSFDNVPLPTTRVRVPRKITYDEETDIVDMNVSCSEDIFEKPCISPPEIVRQKMERAHVSFASDSPMKIKEHNPAALLPVTKNVIIDSPLTLALAGMGDNVEDFENVESIEPIEGTYRNPISKKMLLGNSHKLPTDKHLISNLGNIRKQLDIEHQKLKQQVRTTQ